MTDKISTVSNALIESKNVACNFAPDTSLRAALEHCGTLVESEDILVPWKMFFSDGGYQSVQ